MLLFKITSFTNNDDNGFEESIELMDWISVYKKEIYLIFYIVKIKSYFLIMVLI